MAAVYKYKLVNSSPVPNSTHHHHQQQQQEEEEEEETAVISRAFVQGKTAQPAHPPLFAAR